MCRQAKTGTPAHSLVSGSLKDYTPALEALPALSPAAARFWDFPAFSGVCIEYCEIYAILLLFALTSDISQCLGSAFEAATHLPDSTTNNDAHKTATCHTSHHKGSTGLDARMGIACQAGRRAADSYLWIGACFPASTRADAPCCGHSSQPHHQPTIPSASVGQLALPSHIPVVGSAETEHCASQRVGGGAWQGVAADHRGRQGGEEGERPCVLDHIIWDTHR